MKIGFLGLCSFGLEYMRLLVEKGLDVSFATSKRYPAAHVSEFERSFQYLCKDANVSYLGARNVNDEDIVDRACDVDLVILGGYDGIIHKPFIEAVHGEVYNTHLGIIPYNRGCYPVVHALMADDVAGFTTYRVTPEIDSGLIVHQNKTLIRSEDTAKTLYDRLCRFVVADFSRTLDKILTGWKPQIPLYPGQFYHVQGMPNDRWISWEWRGDFLLRFSRALNFPPYPGPRTCRFGEDENVELYVVQFQKKPLPAPPGTVVEIVKNRAVVTCANGVVTCLVVDNRLRPGDKLESVTGPSNKQNFPIPIHYGQDRMCYGDVTPIIIS
ncbi:hypothetical protein GO013_12520 [Pseudodesulfovibrio sp. JC047]|uniref:formyltransferase family protein n=1 Tax=Pseudodesulfovibrio sp. JC047 TaxID=2683199 RepID=UPI0013D78762|nr:formyltransferase family protein [Pseudodesulfovibrio sp. JC047]NDV20235.1 hypothetical protein [Pseudodesulfovibrio sp. JC047]